MAVRKSRREKLQMPVGPYRKRQPRARRVPDPGAFLLTIAKAIAKGNPLAGQAWSTEKKSSVAVRAKNLVRLGYVQLAHPRGWCAGSRAMISLEQEGGKDDVEAPFDYWSEDMPETVESINDGMPGLFIELQNAGVACVYDE